MAGLTPAGFEIKRLQEILSELETELRKEFGPETATGPGSAFGRLLGIMSRPIAEVWELAQAVYASQFPATADGVALDNAVDVNLLRRKTAQPSRAWTLLTGEPSTLVPAGSVISHASSQQRYQTTEDVITSLATRVLAAAWQISGAPHGAGETYSVTIDGVTEIFTTAGGESNADIAAGLAALLDPAFALLAVDQDARSFTVGGDQTARFNLPGKQLRIEGNLGTPSNNGRYTIVSASFAVNTTIFVAQEIPSPDDTGVVRWNVGAVGGLLGSPSLAIAAFGASPNFLPPQATDAADFEAAVAFSASIPANMTLTEVGKAHRVEALETGPQEAEVNTLTVIDTPVTGWLSVTNAIAADLGRQRETDAQLRLRRAQLLDTHSVSAILRAVLAVEQVDEARIFENPTDATDAEGRPPHSVEAVATGGDDDEIAEAIFEAKAAGIATHGDAVQVITDSQGMEHTIRFSRPTDLLVWVEVTVDALYAEESLPALPAQAIKDAVVAHGASYRAGLDVIPQRVGAAVLQAVSGLAALTVKVGDAAPPAVFEATLDVSDRQRARFAVGRVSVVGV